jgi:hypothetical protein
MENNNKKSPLKNPFAAIGSALGFGAKSGIMSLNPALAGGIIFGGALMARSARKKDRRLRGQLADQQAAFEERLMQYENMDFQPIDTDALQRENIFEDLEINTEAFEASRKAFQQSQANILQGLRGVAGASGVAGLAQALGMQAAEQSEQLRLTVAEQLMRNKELRLQEESRLGDQLMQIEIANQEGARQFELDKLRTLINVEGQRVAGIRGDIAGRRQMYGQMAGGIGSIIGAGIKGA